MTDPAASKAIPRRFDIACWTPHEAFLMEVYSAVEALGAHPKLTDTVTHLMKAFDSLADWHDEGRPGVYTQEDPLPAGDETLGLYKKFVVFRTDGSSQPEGKHHKCPYFVLDLKHDPYALPALAAYATACRETHPKLAKDLADIWVEKMDGLVDPGPPEDSGHL